MIEIKSSVKLPRYENELTNTDVGVEKEVVRRRLTIVKEDVKEFGMTAGCRGCIAVNRGGQAVHHSGTCRERIVEELVKKGDSRVDRREKERREDESAEALRDEQIWSTQL